MDIEGEFRLSLCIDSFESTELELRNEIPDGTLGRRDLRFNETRALYLSSIVFSEYEEAVRV